MKKMHGETLKLLRCFRQHPKDLYFFV